MSIQRNEKLTQMNRDRAFRMWAERAYANDTRPPSHCYRCGGIVMPEDPSVTEHLGRRRSRTFHWGCHELAEIGA